ncbi:N-6 DNA methylase [Halorubellus sp. JP-L1]|nr:N-6 DNA methylase [Halorubellus sp. JP-L1]
MQDTKRRRGRRETSFITTSGGLLTEQLLYKLRNEACSEEAVAPQTFAIGDAVPEGEAAVERDISAAWETLVERWDEISRDNSVFGMDVSAIRNQWLLKLFDALGFEPEFQQSNLEASGIEANLSHLGWPPQESVQAAGSEFEGVPPVLHMTQPDADHRLDDGDHDGTGARQKSPHDELQTYLNASSEVQWSVVTDGLKLRVLRDFYHTYTRGYVEFDLENIFTNRNFGDFRALYRLCHASRFTSEDDDDERPVESLYQVSIATGVKVGEDLQSNVVEALETLGNGFLTPAIREQLEAGGQDVADAYYQDQLRIVYRLLFLMFAEQRGMMADRGDLYTDEYSVSALRERAERQSVRDSATDLWEGLQVTFELVGEGHDDEHLHVPGYNGGLFDDENLSFVDEATCPNHALLDAVHNLTHVEQEGYQQRISYADLGVDEIGAVYESLLEFTPQYATEVPELEERDISRGEFYLDSRGMERKETGSYYTKPELVDELIDSTLKPVVEERIESVESADAKEKALLDIDVCDPACGSGAFLIAANNFLGKRLAEIRTDSAYPDEQELRQARRSVVQHCIYGVDLNPMAVELAKVSLWINSAVENQPLSFLDHRIKQGNSLIGATEELVSGGVPVDAYETSSGCDWHVGNKIRKRVRQENKNIPDEPQVQTGLDWSSFSDEGEHVALAEEIENLEEGSIEAVERKAELYDAFEDSESLNRERLAFDVWTAAFYWPLDGSASEYPSPNTIEKVRREAPEELTDTNGDLGDMCQRARELSETHSFFHWELEFPLVYDAGGFDCIIGNPPWEKLNFEAEQFFAVSRPDIANASTAAKRNMMIDQLQEENPELYEQYQASAEGAEHAMSFMRTSGRYELTGRGHVNTYALFAELSLNSINDQGYNGLIVPTGIATDSTTQEYFRKLVEEKRLKSLYDFVNKKNIFPAVDSRVKFCLLTQAGSANPQESFKLAFYLTEIQQLYQDDSHFSLTSEDISKINPNTKNCPTFETKGDAELVLEIYENSGAFIIVDDPEGNPWNADIHRMFNMSDDSGLFVDIQDLDWDDYDRDGQLLYPCLDSGDTLIGLYESKLTHQYNHRFATFGGIADEAVERGDAYEFSPSELDDETKLASPRYWIPFTEYEDKSGRDWHIALRDITNATNRRTAIFSILPEAASGHSLNHVTGPSAQEALLLVAAFNSYTQDFVARQKVGGTHMSHFITRQLPIPDPGRFQALHYQGEPVADHIQELAIQLTYHAEDLREFAKEAGYDRDPYSYTQPNGRPRKEVRYELEALMAHVYGIEADDFERLFSTFEQIKTEDINEHGHYRTRDEIKQRFEDMKDDITITQEIQQ